MNGLQLSSWDILHDRIGEVKGVSDYRVSIYKHIKDSYRYSLRFYPLGLNQRQLEVKDIPFLGFRKEYRKLVLSGLFVPPEKRLNGIGKLMFEVFSRTQDLLNLQSNETGKINKPTTSVFLNKIGFQGKEKGTKIKLIGETEDGISIIKQFDSTAICKGKKGHQFLIIDESANEEQGIITTLGTKFELEDYNLFSQFRDQVSISNKIQLYKGRLKRILL